MSSFTDLESLRVEVRRRIGGIDAGKLKTSTLDEEDAARDALSEFNGVRPRTFVHDEAGTGSKRRFVLSTTISSWDDDLSELLTLELVEDPDTDDEVADEIDDEDWQIRPTAGDGLVLFVGTAPGSDQYLRFTWTLPHTVKDLDGAAETTLGEKDKAVFLLLVAAELCDLVARKASDQADHTMGVDQVNFRTFETVWKDSAKRLRERAAERLAPTKLHTGAAGASTEWEPRSRRGVSRISH